MADAYGAPHKVVLIGKESEWGTAVSATKDVGIVTDVSTPQEREVHEVGAGSAGSVETQQVKRGTHGGGVEATIEYQHGRLLEYALGSVSHDDTDAPDVKHTFSVANDHPSATFETSNDSSDDVANTLPGQLVESLEIGYTDGETLKLSLTTKGKGFEEPTTSASAATISDLTTYDKGMVHVSVNEEEAPMVQEASINIANKVERVPGSGSYDYQAGAVVEKRFEFRARLGFSDETYHQLQYDATSHKFLINAHNDITAGDGRRELYFELDDCQFETFNEIMSAGGITYVEIAGKGTLSEAYSYDNIDSSSW